MLDVILAVHLLMVQPTCASIAAVLSSSLAVPHALLSGRNRDETMSVAPVIEYVRASAISVVSASEPGPVLRIAPSHGEVQ